MFINSDRLQTRTVLELAEELLTGGEVVWWVGCVCVCVHVGFLLFLKPISNIKINYLIFHFKKKLYQIIKLMSKKTLLMEKEKASKCEALPNRYINLV